MKIEHVALWTTDLERMKTFYTTYFEATVNDKYENQAKAFESYFLSFKTGARLEIMRRPKLSVHDETQVYIGYAHLAFALESREAVLLLTERLRTDGYTIESEPRVTGDGYFESCVKDPDGNLVELTIESDLNKPI